MGGVCASKVNKPSGQIKNNCDTYDDNKAERACESKNTIRNFNTSNAVPNEPHRKVIFQDGNTSKTQLQIQKRQPSQEGPSNTIIGKKEALGKSNVKEITISTSPLQLQSNESYKKDSLGIPTQSCQRVLGETDHNSSAKATVEQTTVKSKVDKSETKIVDFQPAVPKEKAKATLSDPNDEHETKIIDFQPTMPQKKMTAAVGDPNDEHSREHNGGIPPVTDRVVNAGEEDDLKLQSLTKIEQLRVLNWKFGKIDKNDDDLISKEEFLDALKTTSTADLGPDDFTKIDASGKGFITRKDFTKFYLLRA